MMNIINEKDDLFLDLTFTNKEGLPVVPTKLVYRIDDVLSGARIRDDTLLYPSLSTHTIVITSAENSIINVDPGEEDKRVTLSMYYLDEEDVERRKNVEYIYTVTNLRMLETPILVINDGISQVSNDSIALVI